MKGAHSLQSTYGVLGFQGPTKSNLGSQMHESKGQHRGNPYKVLTGGFFRM